MDCTQYPNAVKWAKGTHAAHTHNVKRGVLVCPMAFPRLIRSSKLHTKTLPIGPSNPTHPLTTPPLQTAAWRS